MLQIHDNSLVAHSIDCLNRKRMFEAISEPSKKLQNLGQSNSESKGDHPPPNEGSRSTRQKRTIWNDNQEKKDFRRHIELKECQRRGVLLLTAKSHCNTSHMVQPLDQHVNGYFKELLRTDFKIIMKVHIRKG
jgi:hypothetical protein